jgi:hypothetical protein
VSSRNCLADWFPRLQAAGVPVPRTEIVRWAGQPEALADLLDGKEPKGFKGFVAALTIAAAKVGGPPAFLRTGQGSGKHSWASTCHVTDLAKLPDHVERLVEWSHMVSFLGALPFDVWAVRELLPTTPRVLLPSYDGFPLVREARGFVGNGEVKCVHPYWPADAIRQGFPMKAGGLDDPFEYDVPADFEVVVRWATDLDAFPPGWRELLGRVAAAFAGDGTWSVDVLLTDKGYYVTDMAEAERSYHWPGCPKGPRAAEVVP